jgi:hypothetical protein
MYCLSLIAMLLPTLTPSVALAPDESRVTLRGKFVLDGAAPNRPVFKLAAALGGQPIVDESLVVDPRGGIANIAVWCMTKEVKISRECNDRLGRKAVLDIRGFRYEPHVLAMWTEEILELHNSDGVGHNPNLAPIGSPAINPLLPPNGTAQYKFQRSQLVPVPITCNIHPWIVGYVIARDTPYVAVSKSDGTFEIRHLPTGELEFRAWQEKSGYLAGPQFDKGKFKVTLASGDNDLGTIKLAVRQFNP